MRSRPILLAAATLTVVFAGGATLAACDRPAPAGVEQQPDGQDGDCDTGDLYESKPDPDCGGLWLGTPNPKTATKAPIVRRSVTTRRTR